MKTTLSALLASGQPVVADGAMGSILMAAGLEAGRSPELWNVEQPETIAQVHRGYIQAGSQIILTNSFGGSRTSQDRHDQGERVGELNRAAARIARAEADAAAHPVAVGGSMGPTSEMMVPFGTLTVEEATAVFAEQAAALAEGGVDIFWIETMYALDEMLAAVAGCRLAAPDMPITATMSYDRKGRTMMGVRPEEAMTALRDLGVAAIGANCGNGPDEIIEVISKMHAFDPRVSLIAKANAGMPQYRDGRTVYDATPAEMAAYATAVRQNGAQIIGACCGSTAVHIAAIAQTLHPPLEV
ncbi:MAG: homocysteine S-methyltransferase family protein [Chloroflexi bacterium]|jgi:5-methyltetrahydrofolate--homocysteine methyltransferase|nr:homocysteine S-methyltransferase family protein [Chloroflexota bacterium]MBK8935519.1 homocysteine S-methyltransferase family protein [Chloroflexota bacterium]